MKILSIECSATPCSAAVSENGKILASRFTLDRLTHSQTLMPMVEEVLRESNTSINEVDGFAIAAGPGSFTGVRIGISAVKGLAAASKKPCAAVSTLYAMAHIFKDTDCIVCAVMDARCNQVYNANFDISGGKISRICEDRALLCEELKKEIEKLSQNENKCVIIMGDGAEMFFEYVKDFENVKLADEGCRYQDADGVAFAATERFAKGETVTPEKLLPVYLRLPQAERELKLKRSNEQ
jgi:tRNA threonylcarbamoyladenosine biosynthesis protein TsaB